MFKREYVTNNKKTGTRYVTHRLVESIKTEKDPRQMIIMHLGTLGLPKAEWRSLTALLESHLAGQISLLEEEFPAIADAANMAFDHYKFVQSHRKERKCQKSNRHVVPIDMESISTGFSRSLGPELVADTIWHRLEFDEVLSNYELDKRQICFATVTIIGRLIQTGSDYKTWQWLQKKTALFEMLGVDLATKGVNPFDSGYLKSNSSTAVIDVVAVSSFQYGELMSLPWVKGGVLANYQRRVVPIALELWLTSVNLGRCSRSGAEKVRPKGDFVLFCYAVVLMPFL